MPKIYEITCEVCDANITKSSRIEAGTVDPYCPNLDRTLYFCGYPHMYLYFDGKKPQNDEILVLHITTGLGLGDEYFDGRTSMSTEDLKPAFQMLRDECSGKITEPGIYEMRLKIVKLK